MPRKPLQLELRISIRSIVPGRREEFSLTSLTACWIATLATFPMVESKVKMAPTFTKAGLVAADEPLCVLKPFTPKFKFTSKTRLHTRTLIISYHK
ncbi:hypothetical protein Hdeb2414_s0006g00224771 [Helianthus debilis subsp. tardiflorus]